MSYLEHGALPSAVPSARLHARLIVSEWGLGELAGTVELIVSELVTNAVQASQDLSGSRFLGRRAPGPPPVRLWLQADGHRVVIQVWDGSQRMPHTQASAGLPLPNTGPGSPRCRGSPGGQSPMSATCSGSWTAPIRVSTTVRR